ncbi:MAG: hypothetical protein KF901_02945 [Myxococcales bacterium]|nr:hypothetical protein [Myxococcales bacterium]
MSKDLTTRIRVPHESLSTRIGALELGKAKAYADFIREGDLVLRSPAGALAARRRRDRAEAALRRADAPARRAPGASRRAAGADTPQPRGDPGFGELPCVGVCAKVVAGGRVALGDFVRFEPACRVQPCLQGIEIKHKIDADTGRS